MGDSDEFVEFKEKPCLEQVYGDKIIPNHLKDLFQKSLADRLENVWEIGVGEFDLPFKAKKRSDKEGLILALCTVDFELNKEKPQSSKCVADSRRGVTFLDFEEKTGCYFGITPTHKEIRLCSEGQNIVFKYTGQEDQRIYAMGDLYSNYRLSANSIEKN